MMGELVDKLIGMQKKSDKMMMELKMKRAWTVGILATYSSYILN